jgi:opacity protein-like surface antigen
MKTLRMLTMAVVMGLSFAARAATPPPAENPEPAKTHPIPGPAEKVEPKDPAAAPAASGEVHAAEPVKAEAGESKASMDFLIAPKLGFFKTTTSMSGAFYAGLEAGVITPLLDKKLGVVFEANWHRPNQAGALSSPQLTAGDASYSMKTDELALMLSAIYRQPELLVKELTVYGGLGPGMFLHKVTSEAFGSTYTETSTTFGLQLLAGAEYQLGPGGAFLELRYHYTGVDMTITGQSNLGGFLAAGLGYRLKF